jgi:hypothetical protein
MKSLRKSKRVDVSENNHEASAGDGATPDAVTTNGEAPNGEAPNGEMPTSEVPAAQAQVPTGEASNGEVSNGEVAGASSPAPPPPPSGEDSLPEPQMVDEDRLPVGFWVQSLVDTGKPPAREDLDRQAELDFQAAISPSMAGLHEAVPDASSPEEAMRALEERLGEPTPDPEARKGFASDIYNDDTTVYYRIRAHFEKPKRRVGWQRTQPWQPPQGLAGRGR